MIIKIIPLIKSGHIFANTLKITHPWIDIEEWEYLKLSDSIKEGLADLEEKEIIRILKIEGTEEEELNDDKALTYDFDEPVEGPESEACIFGGSPIMPSGNIEGSNACDFISFFFPSQPPTMDLAGSPDFGFYEIGYYIANPQISGRGHLGSNPIGVFVLMELFRGNTSGISLGTIITPNANTWYPLPDNFTITTDQQYSGMVRDDEGRIASASNYYRFVYPIFATTVNITTLTPQTLVAHTNTYFQTNMVAEDDFGNKQIADFSNLHSVITGVQFYNTVSSNWEWINGSKAASLNSFTISATTHIVQGNVVDYTKYEHNSIKVGARDLRWYTN